MKGQIDDKRAIRLDKWLWASRFFKSRSLATIAIAGGKVRLNGARTKPAHLVREGDIVNVRRGDDELECVVRALAERRGPAREAALLYEKTAASIQQREERLAQRQLDPYTAPRPPGRPNKKDRRHIIRFVRSDRT
jgi:ribosome-associated heat shock protein Hsp15